jgi:hypothetical protein
MQLGAWLPASALKVNTSLLLAADAQYDLFASGNLHKFPERMSNAHITDVTHWLLSLGISVKDGEGGENSTAAAVTSAIRGCGGISGTSSNSKTAPPLSLQQDRLRNGEILCDLLLLLEPDAASHAHLAKVLLSTIFYDVEINLVLLDLLYVQLILVS